MASDPGAAAGAPDAPRLRDLLSRCTHCGDCLEACPTYVISGLELESPRGRIALLEHALATDTDTATATATATDDQVLSAHIDSCTGCMACVSACPEGVRYDEVLPLARALADRARPDTHAAARGADAARRLATDTLAHPWTLKRLTPMLRAAEHLPARRVPEPVRSLTQIVKAPPRSGAGTAEIPEFTPATGASRGRVGLLLGCRERVMHPEIHHATIAVLAAEGFEVLAPRSPDCCGALHLHRGDRAGAVKRAEQTLAAFQAIGGVDQILTSSGACGATMQSYGSLIATAQARAFASLTSDVCAFLIRKRARTPRGPLPLTVAWHDSCQVTHAQRGELPARTLLTRVPSLQLLDTTEPGLCCGANGTYPLDQPEISQTLGARRAQQLIETGAQAIVSTSPECATQISRHARTLGHELPIHHPIELLARSLGLA